MISLVHQRNFRNNESIRPGNVASVGDALSQSRLKSSLPGDFRWDSIDRNYGSNANEGGNRPAARVSDSNWGGRKSFKHAYGWSYQDLRAPDKLTEPYMGSMPQYSWRNKLASVYNAKTTGDLFPIPNGGLINPPTDLLYRGGMYPRITDIVSGNDEPPSFTPSNMNQRGHELSGGANFSNGKFSGNEKAGRFSTFKPTSSSFQPGDNPLEKLKRDLSNGKKGTLGRRR